VSIAEEFATPRPARLMSAMLPATLDSTMCSSALTTIFGSGGRLAPLPGADRLAARSTASMPHVAETIVDDVVVAQAWPLTGSVRHAGTSESRG